MPTEQMLTQNIQKKPLISFIVTTYNTPSDMLEECLKSLLSLQLESWEREVILIDDGSQLPAITDLEAWQDDIIYLRQPNSGISAARNRGMDMATGRYIQFVDGDDLLLQQPYEHCLELLRTMHPDIVSFRLTSKNANHTEKYQIEGPIDGSIFMLHNNVRGAICSYIFKAELPINLRFSVGTAYSEDEEFTPQLLLRCEQLVTTTAEAYYYRQHESSATHLKDNCHIEKRLDDNLTVITRLDRLADTLHGTDREALRRRVTQLTMDYLYHIIQLRRSPQETELAVKKLHDMGLFPLPKKNYTRKYQWFRLAMSTKAGRWIMSHFMPNLS